MANSTAAKSRRFVRDYANLPIKYLADDLFTGMKDPLFSFIQGTFNALGAEQAPGLMNNLTRSDYNNNFSAAQTIAAPAAELYVENTDAESNPGSIRVATNDNYVQLATYADGYTVDEDQAGRVGVILNSSGSGFIRVINTNNGGDLLIIEGVEGKVLTVKSDLTIQLHQYSAGFLKSDETGNITSEEYAGSGSVDDGDLSANVPLLDNDVNYFTGKLGSGDIPEYSNNANAISGGLTPGMFYHTSGNMKVVLPP